MKTRIIVGLTTLSLVTGCGLFKKKDDPGTTETNSGTGSGGSAPADTDKPVNAAGCTLPEGDLKGTVTLKKGCTVKVTNNINITENGTLNIEPGVKMLMSQGIYVQLTDGKIVAKGTEKEPIVFTSANSTRAPGDWAAIFLMDKTGAGTTFEHVKFEYGGATGNDGKAALDIRDQQSSGRVSVVNCTFSNNDQAAITNDSSKGGFAKFTGNKFEKNKTSLIAHAKVLGTVGPGNVFSDPIVARGEVDEDTTWPAFGVPVIVDDNINVQGERTAPKLSIAPGTIVKVSGGHLFGIGDKSGGSLIAPGVTFTSSNATPNAGDWSGIFVYQHASVVDLKGATIEYAGEGNSSSAAMTFYGCSVKDVKGLSVANITFKHSAHAAVSSDDHECAAFNGAKSEGAPLCRKE